MLNIGKEKKLIILITLICIMLIFALPIFSAADEQRWRIGTLVPETVPAGAGMYEYARLIEERTDGQIKMDCYPVQQLGNWMDQFDNIGKGMQEAGFIPPSPRYDKFTAGFIDFAITDWDMVERAYGKNGFMFKYNEKGCKELGIKLLGIVSAGFEGYSGRKGPVVYPEDITKLKIKTRVGYPPSKMYYEDLGPVVSIDMNEVFTALQLGTIDCQANQAVETVYTQFHDVTRYFTDINSLPAIIGILINQELFDSLSPKIQEILETTADEIVKKVNEESRAKEEEYYRKFEEEGVTIIRLTPDQRRKWVERARMPGGMWDKARELMGDEPIDFLLENLEK